jgi:Mrp family chromosome partitioning ATPase
MLRTRGRGAVVAGVDGSAESALAVAVARAVASLGRADLRMTSASSDQVGGDGARRIAPELEEREGRAVGGLASESEIADLDVVGSRGLRG